ncbi:hypothetical protein AB7M16_005033 [Bradyrhizobium sp. USDA 372]
MTARRCATATSLAAGPSIVLKEAREGWPPKDSRCNEGCSHVVCPGGLGHLPAHKGWRHRFRSALASAPHVPSLSASRFRRSGGHCLACNFLRLCSGERRACVELRPLDYPPAMLHVSRDREQLFNGSARFGRQLNRLRNCLVSERRPMPTQRLSMRRIKGVLRLKHVQGLPERAIAHTLGISNGAAHSYVR